LHSFCPRPARRPPIKIGGVWIAIMGKFAMVGLPVSIYLVRLLHSRLRLIEMIEGILYKIIDVDNISHFMLLSQAVAAITHFFYTLDEETPANIQYSRPPSPNHAYPPLPLPRLNSLIKPLPTPKIPQSGHTYHILTTLYFKCRRVGWRVGGRRTVTFRICHHLYQPCWRLCRQSHIPSSWPVEGTMK